MSTGGIFTLITNDGKQDRMLMATELLRSRIRTLAAIRLAKGKDPTPTLMDIEKTHILFMNSHFKPFAALGFEYNRVKPNSGIIQLGGTIQFSIPQFGDFFHDMALHFVLGSPTVSGGTNPTYRWCAYPGERLIKKAKFTINGNPLDEYFTSEIVAHRQYEIPPNKLEGYKRCVGQESPVLSEIYQDNSSATNSRVLCHYANGFQTPKRNHGNLELFIPLLFWFNRDIALSIPSVAIPFGQRYLEFDLANQNEMIGIESRGDSSGGTLGSVPIITCELYINNIFVNPEIHDIYIKRIAFNLIRVHKRQATRLTTSEYNVLLSNIKWPVERLSVGFQPTGNSAPANQNFSGSGNGINHLDHWHFFSQVKRFDVAGNPLTVYADIQQPAVDSISVQAHGINIYDKFPNLFYSSYLPFKFGKKINTPEDIGLNMITFSVHPGSYQPSGHINISRAREFYVSYTSGVNSTAISLSNPVDMIVNATVINFLLISDGSAVLRYTT